jgi:hypothetical protein
VRRKAFVAFALILLLAGGTIFGAAEKHKMKICSMLGDMGGNVGIFKSVGRYVVGRFVSVDLNIVIINTLFPVSGNLTLELPLWRFVFYVTGGLGYSLIGGGTKNVGTGLMIRLTQQMGFLADYRHYTHKPFFGKHMANFIGGGIFYLF